MLGIIFTRKRMLAAWAVENAVKWIPLGQHGNLHAPINGNLVDTFRAHFHRILDIASWHAFGNGMTPLDSLPLALVFPSDESYIAELEKQAVLDWLDVQQIRWSSVRVHRMAPLLSNALVQQPATHLVFEAIDDEAFWHTNDSQINYIMQDFDGMQLGKGEGVRNLLKIFLSEIQQKNVLITSSQIDEIRSHIEHFILNKKLIINQLDTFPRVSIDLSLSQSRYYDLLTFQRNNYKNILNNLKIFVNSNIYFIFASDFYDNAVFREYLSHHFKVLNFSKAKILYLNDEQTFESVLLFLRKQVKIKEAQSNQLTRARLIAEIKAKCTDKKKFREYIQKYLPLGQQLGMLDEVILFYIKQNIYGLHSLKSIGEVIQSPENQKKPSINESTHEQKSAPATAMSYNNYQLPLRKNTNVVNRLSEKSVNRDTNEQERPFSELTTSLSLNATEDSVVSITNNLQSTLRSYDDESLRDINGFAHFVNEFSSSEFLYFKAKLNESGKLKVIRYLKNNADATGVQAFELLHAREQSYYSDVSQIISTSNGARYYYRDYFEGELIEQYLKRIGLHKKYRLKDLSAIELELMLDLWRSIHYLKFAFADLNKDCFIVNVHWRLPFKKEIEVKIVNFDSTTATKAQMEQNLWEIFEEIFGTNLTNEFRHQFQYT